MIPVTSHLICLALPFEAVAVVVLLLQNVM
jgi:hypothetical protein